MNLSKDLINTLKKLQFSELSLRKVEIFKNLLLQFNKSYNLISKSSEKIVDSRHILDSAQIVKYINFKFENSLSDFGTGGGFPGILLAIYNNNPKFHVKLHEKSKVKCDFLKKCIKNLGIKATVVRNLLEANGIQPAEPNKSKLSGSELGHRITKGTVHLSCLMTMAQIQQVREQKVMFTEFN